MNRLLSAFVCAAIITALGAFSGCASNADLQQVQNKQFQLRGLIASQNQQIQSLQQQIRRQHDEIEELQHGGGAGGSQGLPDQIATLQDRMNKLEASINALQAGAPPALPGAPAPSGPGAPPPAGASAAPAPSVPSWQADLDRELSAKPSGAGSKIYREGLDAMKSGNYSSAVGKFSLLQRKYPKSPLVQHGEYFSANALFELGKYGQSILQFNDLAMRYPKGRYACAALLREGEAFAKMDDKVDARLTLQKLIDDHGECAEASVAGTMMKDLQN